MTEQEIRKAYMKNSELSAEELEQINLGVAETQRLLQIVTLIPGARELAESDTQAFHAKYGLDNVDTDIIKYFCDADFIKASSNKTEQEYLASVPERVFRYRQFLSNKLAWRKNLFELACVPQNQRMKHWRERQINRCKNFSGTAYDSNIHIPLTFELNYGCSVGCPFCAAGAKKLQKLFRHTPENAKLFRELLDAAGEVIGKAAGQGTLYYACEPLDNPDLELFLEDYYSITGQYPQITTAVALRDTERTGKLLARQAELNATIHRFSMFSEEDVMTVLNTFTPMQLLSVELLGQYESAPSFVGFAKAGNARDNDEVCTGDVVVDSICCVTGFIVNLPCKTIRLTTSTNADERYPMGEMQYETASFTDAEDFKSQLIRMIDKYMPKNCPKDLPLRLYPYFWLDKKNGHSMLRTRAIAYELDKLSPWSATEVVEAMMETPLTAAELTKKLHRERNIPPEHTRWVIDLLWKRGVIDEIYP